MRSGDSPLASTIDGEAAAPVENPSIVRASRRSSLDWSFAFFVFLACAMVAVICAVSTGFAIGAIAFCAVALAASGVYLARRDAVSLLTLMLCLLFLMPEDYVFSGPLKSVGYPAMDVAFIGLVMWIVGRALRTIPRNIGHPVHWLVFGYLVFALTAFAAAMSRALTQIESDGAGRALFPIAAEVGIALLACDAILTRVDLDRLLQRLVLLGGISAFIGVIEFAFKGFSYRSFMNFPGFTINVETISDTRSSFERVQAGASHPIEYAVACATLVPLALHFTTYAATKRMRQWSRIAVVMLLIVLPMTVSRSAVLAVAVSLIFYAAQWSPRNRLNALIVGVVGLAAFRAAVPGLLGTVTALFTSASQDPSVQHRTDDYAQLPQLLAGRWIWGRGIGTFQAAQYFFLDNEYLYSLLEGGVLALGMLIVVYVGGVCLARGARKWSIDPATRSLGQAMAGGIAALAASAVTFDELSFKQNVFLLFLLLGCAGRLWTLSRADAAQRSTAPPVDVAQAQPAAPLL